MNMISSTDTAITIAGTPPNTGSIIAAAIAGTGPYAGQGPMQPNSWRQINVPNQNAVLGLAGGNMSSLLPYANKMCWNPKRGRAEIMGRDHGINAQGICLIYYDPVANAYTQKAVFEPPLSGHGYDHQAINPTTGDLYIKRYGSEITQPHGYRKTVDGLSVSELKLPQAVMQGVANATCWVPSGFMGAGAQGAFMTYMCGDPGRPTAGVLQWYDPVADTWSLRDSRAPNAGVDQKTDYHLVMAYSKKANCVVYGGGNYTSPHLWRTDAAGVVTPMPDAPVPVGCNEMGNSGKFCADPATGKLLALWQDKLWELDPSAAGTWAQLQGPPHALGKNDGAYSDNGGLICIEDSDDRVTLWVRQPQGNGGETWVYKR
jgi:hypothetical protein